MIRLTFAASVWLCMITVANCQEPTTSLPSTESASRAAKPPYERLLQGDDAQKAAACQKQIEKFAEADDYVAAIKVAEELLALRVKSQGERHHEAVNAKYDLVVLRAVAARDADKRKEWRAAMQKGKEADRLEAQAKYAQALPIRQQILDVRRQVLGDAHPDIATSYTDLAATLYAQRKPNEAVQLLERALEIRREILGNEHPKTAASCTNLALNLNARGKTDEAVPLAQESLEIMRKVLGEEHPATAACHTTLALNLTALGKLAEAELPLERALEINRKVLGEKHLDTAWSYNNLAVNLSEQGRLAEAALVFQKVLEIQRKVLGEMHPATATSYNNLASILTQQGKPARAAPLLQRALDICRNILGEEHPQTATSYSNLALCLAAQGKVAEATPLFQKVLEINRNVLGQDHPGTADSYNNLAANLRDQHKATEAVPLLQRALEIQRNALGESHPTTAMSYLNLALSLADQGKRSEAEPLFNRALEVQRKVLGEGHPAVAQSYKNLAFVLTGLGKTDEATATLKRAIFAYEASRLAGAKGMERALLRDLDPYSLLAVLEQSHAPDESWHNLESTLARGLMDEHSQAHDSMKTEEQTQLAQLRNQLAALQSEVLRLTPRQKPSAREEAQLEVLQSERRKTERSLAALAVSVSTRRIARGESIREAIPQDAALLLWVDITNGIANLQEHWACVVRREGSATWERLPGVGQRGAWTKEDRELPTRLRRELRGAAAHTAELESLIAQLRTQRLAPVEKHLDGVKTLYVVPVHEMAGIPIELLAPEFHVEYVTSGTALARAKDRPKSSAPPSLLAVGDPVFPPADELRSSPLPPSGILVGRVIAGGAAANKILDGDVLLAYGDVELNDLESLQKAIAAKADEKSIPVRLWRVAEDGKAITKTVDVAPGRLGANLAREPARELLAARQKGQTLVTSATISGRVDETTGEKRPWKELPGTAVELSRLQQTFGDQATIYSRSQASEQALEDLRKQDQLKNFRYLHFATHGLANHTRAFESFLALAQDKLPKYDARPGEKYFNGELSAREVLDGWKLDADLVTLSACESGLGKAGGGDGLLGFTQAFLLAGARSVCLSLWEVDDTATALLMDRFYQNLLGKRAGLDGPMKKAAALREAKQWLRNLTAEEVLKLAAEMTHSAKRGKGEPLPPVVQAKTVAPSGDLSVKPYADPRFWSAFILIGEPD